MIHITWYEVLTWAMILSITGRINIWLYHWRNQRNAQKFLQMVRVEYPGSTIVYAAASSRDDLALRKIKKQFEESRST